MAFRSFLVLCSLAWLCACGPRPGDEHEGRGVLVLAIDGLRADHLGVGGNDRPATPVLDGLARQGVWFSNARSTTPDLEGAHATILTGCDGRLASRSAGAGPETATAFARWLIPDVLPSLAEELLRAGYDTAAFADHASIDESLGYGRGFREFRALREEDAAAAGEGFEAASSKFERWLAERSPSSDWFAYVEAHDLVRLWSRRREDPRWSRLFPPRPLMDSVPPVGAFARGFFALARDRWGGGPITIGEYEARYDGELANLDAQIGRVLERMRASGRLRNTTIVVVGTHGTSFGESGLYLDAGTLSDSDLHVPLIVRQPLSAQGMRGGGVHVHIVSTVDVAPTVLDLAGLPRPATMHGVSLAPAVRGEDRALRRYAYASGGLLHGRAVHDDRFCLDESRPGEAEQPQVRETWFGAPQPMSSATRVHLHDRSVPGGGGHIGLGASDAEAQARLAAAAAGWFQRLEEVRLVLHGPGGGRQEALQSLSAPARAAWATEPPR